MSRPSPSHKPLKSDRLPTVHQSQALMADDIEAARAYLLRMGAADLVDMVIGGGE